MADAATTNRGLNVLLVAASLAKVDGGDLPLKLPDAQRGEAPILGDLSTKALFLDSTRSATTKKLVEGDRVGVISLADNDWHHIDWDPETQMFQLIGDDATGTDGFEYSTDPTCAANAGNESPEARVEEFYVAASPVGRLYVRRCNAGNSGNGSNTVKIKHKAFGTREMLSCTRRNAGVAHS